MRFKLVFVSELSSGPLPPRGVPLRDRPVVGPAGERARAARRPRHVWVTGPPGAEGPWPGVLIARRRSLAGGWLFLCVWVVDEGRECLEEDLVVAQQWLRQRLVEPA